MEQLIAASRPWTPAAHPGPPRSPDTPATYILIPRCLIDDLRDSPAALGVYALVARVYRATKAPVPLSPGDLELFDPRLTHGSATRALRRLVDAGYLLRSPSIGRKLAYQPCWGRVHGTPLAWDLAAPRLGCPRHRPAVRLNDRLLDLGMGRLRPHPAHPAAAERYLPRPLFSLREVGSYMLALGQLPVASALLVELGLLDEAGRPLPLPDEATFLALASQRAITGEQEGLTPAGWRRAGFSLPPAPAPTGQALFFVPAGMIGEGPGPLIASRIGLVSVEGAGDLAPACASGELGLGETRSHGSTDSEGANGTPPHSADAHTGCGGGDHVYAHRPRGRAVPDAVTVAGGSEQIEAIELLKGIGVRTDVAAQLAGHTPQQISRLIAQARGRPAVRDAAAWVVSALRALPLADEALVAPARVSDRPILMHAGISGLDRQRWLMRFRNAELAERPEILARFLREHPQAEEYESLEGHSAGCCASTAHITG